MMIRHAFSGGGVPALALSSHALDYRNGVAVGTNWGGTVAWTGGVAPYTVRLLSGSSVQYQTTGITGNNYTLRGPAIKDWNGTVMSLRVIDAAGSSVTTPLYGISIYWLGTVSISVSSTSPSVGNFVALNANISDGNPASYTYQWQYRRRYSASVAWGAWTNFAASAATAYSNTFTTSGEQQEFTCVITNAAGTATAYSSTVIAV